MKDSNPIPVVPYSAIVGQSRIKLALELSYVSPSIGGVLISGERGTGKSTTVRAFAKMVSNRLPVTIPINATDDRVVGGWKIDALVAGKAEPQDGLLKEANNGLLYIDEVNLLDDHIVNIILDVTSSGILEIQREGIVERNEIHFTLVGTMNPEEGGLRPQLLDRFALMVDVQTELGSRKQILKNVLQFEEAVLLARQKQKAPFLEKMLRKDDERRKRLSVARKNLPPLPDFILDYCVNLASAFKIDGHRAERILALSAQANAAIDGSNEVSRDDLKKVASLALQHRRKSSQLTWTSSDQKVVDEVLK